MSLDEMMQYIYHVNVFVTTPHESVKQRNTYISVVCSFFCFWLVRDVFAQISLAQTEQKRHTSLHCGSKSITEVLHFIITKVF